MKRNYLESRGEARGWKHPRALSRFFLAFAFATLTFATGAASAAPAAGSSIENQAEASYYHPVLAGFELIRSNKTVLEVAPVVGANLLSDQTRTGTPGQTLAFPHQLINTGNTSETFVFSYGNGTADDFDLNSLTLVVDANSDGVFNSNETVIAPGGGYTLQPGETVPLLLLGTVPNTAPDNGQAVMDLTVSSSVGDLLATVSDTVVVSDNATAVLNFNKQVSTFSSAPGETIEFTLIGTSVGQGPLEAIAVVIDGTPDSKVIVRDFIPRNTTFSSVTRGGVSEPLYHTFGQPLHEYASIAPSDPADVDAIAFAYDIMEPTFSFDVAFRVRVNDNGAGDIPNTATTYFMDGAFDGTTDSNPVTVTLPSASASFNFFENDDFDDIEAFTEAGAPLQLHLDAAICNTDPQAAERYPVRVFTSVSTDTETGFEMVETTPNSGVFILTSITTTNWPAVPQISENGIVEVGRNEVVSATFTSCPGVSVATSILIDPAGIVFDVRTNLPLAGATVTLFGVNPDGSEYVPLVLDTNGSTVSNQFLTGDDGFYEFPLVPPGTYRIDILPPNGYRYPSDFPVTLISPDRRIDEPGSYGGTFAVTPETGPVFIDFPLDPDELLSGLFLEKEVDRSVAGIGEIVTYTLSVTNNTGIDIFDITIEDRLPLGFAYQTGTTRIDSVGVADPNGGAGPDLEFQIGYVPEGASAVVNYSTLIRPGANGRESVNTAQAMSTDAFSNVASATVTTQDTVFFTEGIVAGKVFVDCNLNRLQDPEDLGIPGVRLFLEDGTFVVTDAEGKYSFAGLRATSHVLKVDETTLPVNAVMTTLGNRNAGVGTSHFIDMKRGELFRADFAEGSCAPELVEQVQARRENGEVFTAEVEDRLSADLRTLTGPISTDPRSRPASGIVSGSGRIEAYKPILSDAPEPKLDRLPDPRRETAPRLSLEELIKTLDDEAGFIDLKDGDTLPSQQVSVRVKGKTGGEFKLLVNGDEVPDSRVGQRTKMPSTGVEAWEFVAVNLVAGENQLEVVQMDGFGNRRFWHEITVIAPGGLGKLALDLPGSAAADGRTPVPVVVRLTDDKDVAVTARTPITLEATEGLWDVDDLDPKEPGVQAFIDGGEAIFDLLPAAEPGDAIVRVSSGIIETEGRVTFLPDLRPLIVAGIVEGAVGINDVDAKRVDAVQGDGFEESIGGFDFAGEDGSSAGQRTALYLKGKVRGDYLLTLAYDSDKDTEDRLFRDIRPDEFYAVYGDSSVKGFDAQSTGKLYARVDKGRSYVLYGDFETQSRTEARRLGNYNRSLSGFRQHYESKNVAINIFSSYDDNRRVVRELRGEGISGPYELGDRDLLVNSEQVEIVIRDREQPSIVLATEAQTRFQDYSFDFLTGAILFKRPIPSVDSNLNPIFVRVTYETKGEGDKFWVHGFDGQVRIGDRFELGAGAVMDDNPEQHYELYSANVTAKISEGTHVVAEIAMSDDELKGRGNASRIEVQHAGERLNSRVYGYRSDDDFLNPNASIAAGRNEAGAEATYRLGPKTQLGAELIYTENRNTGGERAGALVTVERQVGDNMRIQSGVRHVDETSSLDTGGVSTNRKTTSLRVRADLQPKAVPEASVFAEYEQDIAVSDSKIIAIGGDYQLANRGRLYLRHEIISSLTGQFGLSEFAPTNHNTVLGFNFDYLDDQNIFSEYRLRDATSGMEAEAAIGLRNSWTVYEGLKLLGGFERIQPMQGDLRESTALTGAVEWTSHPLWKGSGRMEYRRSDDSRSMLGTFGIARKLSRDWTFLSQNTYSIRDNRSTNARELDNLLRVGLAYRDTDTNRWNALARYDLDLSRTDATGEERLAHIWSGSVNYHPNRAWTLSGRYAGKLVDQQGFGFDNDVSAHLLGMRVGYDVAERWDLNLHGATLFDGDMTAQQYGLGFEVGFLLAADLWWSTGYNVFGYDDKELANDEYTSKGIYTRFRFKFDEQIFDRLKWLGDWRSDD